MRGVAALALRGDLQHIGRRRRAFGIDAGALPGGVILGEQDLHRRVDEIGVAEIAGAVGIGALHRLDHDMQRGRRALLHVGHRKAFEDVQRFQQHRAARRRQRHRDDVVAAIIAAHRRAEQRLIRFQIVRRHDAAGIADRLRQFFGDRSFIEAARALFGDRGQRGGQIRLDQPVAVTQRRAIGTGERFCGIRPARHPAIHVGQRVGHVVGDDKTVARQFDRWLDDLRQREFAGAVFFQRQRQARHGAGHADAERRIARFVGVGLAVGAEIHVARGSCRRGLAIVDRDVFVALGGMDHHEAAAADIAGARIGHGQRKAGRDRGVDRVAALPQECRRRCGPRVFPAPPPCRVRRIRHEPWRDPAAYRGGVAPAHGRRAGRNDERDGHQRATPLIRAENHPKSAAVEPV